MKLWTLFLFISAFAFCTTGYTRLGDTEQELLKRFGAPILTSKHFVITQGKFIEFGPTLIFKQEDWSISSDLVDGRCMKISYSKPGDWSEDQIQLVLSTNSQATKWTENTKPAIAALLREWKRSDGSIAKWQKGVGMTLVWDAYDKAKAALEERARLQAIKKPKI